jgi:glycosyltransferase involved in cell wall biosynthesis
VKERLEQETILCVSPTSWFSLWRNRQQIMSRIAKHNTVLFVEPQRNPEQAFLRDVREKTGHLARPQITQEGRNLSIVQVPPALPFGAAIAGPLASQLAALVSKVNNAVLARTIQSALRTLGVQSPILWLYYPWHAGLVGQFGEKLVCYHVYDELAEYPQNRPVRDFIQRSDKALCRKADLIFASSSVQAERRKPLNSETHFVPNAADFDHFNQALAPDLSLPAQVREIPSPRIGYIGFLGFQVNVDLLLGVAKARPDWQLLLIGPDQLGQDERCNTLRGMENVHLLGRKTLAELPAYSKACDVALLPYDLSTHMATSYPLKLHEYLAAGKPVVAVPMRELKPFEDVVYLADSPAAFVRRIEQALREDSQERIRRRTEVAQMNTWDRRVEQISALINRRLEERARL